MFIIRQEVSEDYQVSFVLYERRFYEDNSMYYISDSGYVVYLTETESELIEVDRCTL